MGQAGSHKRSDKQSYLDGKAARLLSGMTDLGEPPINSYDKLVAWMAEMAERDNMELDTNLFLRHMRRLYNQSRKTYLSLPTRQNSGASNESNGSSGAECSSTGITRSPHLSVKNVDIFTRPVLYRQKRVSPHEDIFSEDTTNASIESLYDSDQDPDAVSLSLDEKGWQGKRWDELSQSMYLICDEPRPCTKMFSASVGNLRILNYTGSNNLAQQKSYSALNVYSEIEPVKKPRVSIPEIRKIPPHDELPNEQCLLGQSFLDKNMADILFSVDALWPVK